MGIVAPSGGSYETGTATKDDWRWFLNAILGPGGQVDKLVEAHKNICNILERCNIIKLIVMILRPPPNLSYEERISLVKWYINECLKDFQRIQYDKIRLVGFYWMSESVGKDDTDLVRKVSNIIHNKNLSFYWIPYYFAQGVDAWKDLGFDYVML